MLNINDHCPFIKKKLAILEARLVRNYDRLTYLLTGVRCGATSVAKKRVKLEVYFLNPHRICMKCKLTMTTGWWGTLESNHLAISVYPIILSLCLLFIFSLQTVSSSFFNQIILFLLILKPWTSCFFLFPLALYFFLQYFVSHRQCIHFVSLN